MPPSVADFDFMLTHEYSVVFVLCHDGTII